MSDKPDAPRPTRAEAARQDRLAREAAALRANLHRRKAQSRALADAAPDPAPDPDNAEPTQPGGDAPGQPR